MLRRFFEWNRRLCERIEKHLPEGRGRVTVNYARGIGELLSRTRGLTVLDVGAGRRCSFVEYMEPGANAFVIGQDVETNNLCENPDVNARAVGDAAHLPFRDASVDMIVSHNVLEHLPDIERFFVEGQRVLKPDGYFIHLLSSRYALFAVINRILPHTLSQKLLFFLRPKAREHSGFRTYYDRCYYSAVRRLLTQHGFSTKLRVGYFQSSYFSFFVPFFLLSVLYEDLIRALRLKNLGAYLFIHARKRSRLP